MTRKLDDVERHGRILDRYYTDFSKLVARYIDKVTREEETLFLMQLQERSSVYGSDFDSYRRKA
jgi:hypothetical protein